MGLKARRNKIGDTLENSSANFHFGSGPFFGVDKGRKTGVEISDV